MMNYLLLLMLIVIAVCNYLISGKNVLFPSVIVSGVFCISAFLIVINEKYWQYEVSIDTVVIICLAVVLFSVGSLLGSKVVMPDRREKHFFEKGYCNLDISRFNMRWISLICLIVTFTYAYHQYRLAATLGNEAGIMGVIETIRSQVLINPDVYQLGMFMNIGIAFGRAMGYVCLFNVVTGFICGYRDNKKYIIPIVCLVINTILATGRSAFITMTVSCLFDIYIIQRKCGKQKFNNKMIKYIVIGIVVFFTIFWLAGALTGKSGILSLWDTISIYAGSSVLCLDSFIKHPHPISTTFGMRSFVGLYNFLNRIGFAFPQGSNHAEFVFWQGGKYSSNIYTALFPYIQDFSIAGAIILQLFLGIIFGLIWKRYIGNYAGSMLLITYGRFWGTPLAFYSITEVLFTSNIALNTIVEIFFYIVIIRMIFTKNKKTNAIPKSKHYTLYG